MNKSNVHVLFALSFAEWTYEIYILCISKIQHNTCELSVSFWFQCLVAKVFIVLWTCIYVAFFIQNCMSFKLYIDKHEYTIRLDRQYIKYMNISFCFKLFQFTSTHIYSRLQIYYPRQPGWNSVWDK